MTACYSDPGMQLFTELIHKLLSILNRKFQLSYALGSPIPLLLTLTCPDSQAIDLLSQPSATTVFLTRTIAIGSEATDESAPRRSNNTFPEHLSKAFWWPSEEGAPVEGKSVLHGEIDVGKNVKPGFVFPRFTIRVCGLLSIFKSSRRSMLLILTPRTLRSSTISLFCHSPRRALRRRHLTSLFCRRKWRSLPRMRPGSSRTRMRRPGM